MFFGFDDLDAFAVVASFAGFPDEWWFDIDFVCFFDELICWSGDVFAVEEFSLFSFVLNDF